MRGLHLAVTGSLFVLMMAGCAPPTRFVNHPRPALSVDFSAFTEAGCPPDANGAMLCGPDSPLAAFDCDRIEEPDGLLGGLDPAYPIAYCLYESFRHSGGDYESAARVETEGFMYQSGGIAATYVRYVIFADGQFRALKTREDFAALFAPVESAEEALSFALAHGSYTAFYDLAHERGLRYLAATVEDTHVTETEEGYLVHLFHYQFFGCGPHTTSAIDVQVSPPGKVEEVSVQSMYENPEEDGLCLD